MTAVMEYRYECHEHEWMSDVVPCCKCMGREPKPIKEPPMKLECKAPPLCIYHNNCADGFGAAWAVWKAFGGDVDLFAGTYGDDPPDVKGRDVVFVDFCYQPEVMLALRFEANSILILDHHKSAMEGMTPHLMKQSVGDDADAIHPSDWNNHLTNAYQDQCENIGTQIYGIFDMERSGAGIAWDFFHPDDPRPRLIDHIEDRDLWNFAIGGTREIQAALFSYDYDLELWDYLMGLDLAGMKTLYAEGQSIERKHHKDVAELVNVCVRPMAIGGHQVQVASLPYTLTSDAGHLMAQDAKFAACYWDTAEGRCFSLRSCEGEPRAMDVSLIAKEYGGGGHKNAAGFRVPRNHALAKA